MLWRITQVCSSFGAGYRSFQSFRQCVPQFRSHLLREGKVSLPETRNVHQASGKWRPPVSLKLVVVGLAGLRLCSCTLKVSCQASLDGAGTRLVGVSKYVQEPKFDWRRFLAVLWPHVWYLLGAIVSALAVAVMNIQIPQLLGGMINVMARFTSDIGSTKFIQDMQEPVMKLLYLYVAQSVFTFVYIYLLSCVGERIATTMRRDLFASIMKQDVAFFDHQKTGELVNRLTIDIQDFKSSFKQCISQGLRSITQITGCAVSLFIISPQMTLGMLVVVPTIIVTGTLLGSVLRKMSRRAQEQTSKATVISDEAIGNIRTVRAFAMEAKECELFNEEIEESRKLNEVLGFGIGLFQGGTNLFLNGMVLGTLYAGGYLLSIQQVSAGDLMAFLVATQTIQRSLTQLSLLFGQMVRGMESGARVYEFINFRPRIPLTGGKTIPYHSLRAHIKFDDVTFAYPTRPTQNILRHFSLEFPPGKTVAIVGSSGNGKSTVAALLERFYDVNAGSITIDGVDIRQLDPSWLRGKAIGFINQEPVLFATSIMENIRYGRPDATDDEVRVAAKLANADGFIRQFPRGYSTVLGERGVTVSGGQKQRIAIARALLKNPAILILDEATSALDASSEQAVQGALENATRGRTVLVIAHRLSTIQKADLIVVLDNGVIVETGTHEALVKRRGLYWNLIKQQRESEGSSRAEG